MLYVPLNTQAWLECSVTEGQSVTWAVRLPGRANNNFGDIRLDLFRNQLSTRGIHEEANSTRSSSLVINGTASNNTTAVACVAFTTSDLAGIRSDAVEVIIYGTL